MGMLRGRRSRVLINNRENDMKIKENVKKLAGKRKLISIAIAVFCVAGVVSSLTVGLSANDAATAEESQTYTVTTGSISNEISAAGNLALAETEDLAFEMAGYVSEVLVSTGDSVVAGQELAKLDVDDWNEQLKAYERAVTTAEHNLTVKEAALVKAKRSAAAAERDVAARELAVREAELAVQSAQNDLNNIQEVAEAQAAVDDAEAYVEAIKAIRRGSFNGAIQVVDNTRLNDMQDAAEDDLAAAQEDLQDIIAETGVQLTDNVELQISQAKLAIEKKELALEDAKLAVDDANYAITEANAAVATAQYDLDTATSNLEDARNDLADAKALSPIITAPFDGFIPSISVEGGDEVFKGTIAMQIANPDSFEVEIAVSEVDIMDVEVGGKAWVEVDALSVTLPATVTYIAPTATISSGVVNYMVTVEVQSMTAGSLPFPQAADDAAIPSLTDSQNMTGDGQMPGFTMEDLELRQGLTVTVSLIVSEATDVLVVPYAAVTTEGRQKYVEVLNDDGTTEKRAITTGVTDYSYIEVTDGLTEGEQIVISGTTATTISSSSDSDEQQGGGIMFPGMGGGEPPSGGPPGGGQ